MIDTFVRTAI